MAKKVAEAVKVVPIQIKRLTLSIEGDSPLISHAWSDRAIKAMEDKQAKTAKKGREARNPKQDYEDSLYHHPDGGFGFPAVAFKNSFVSACRFLEDAKMTESRGSVHIVGDMIRLEGKPNMRQDMVRVGMGSADIRYRGEFKKWKATLDIRYNSTSISPEQIVNQFNNAGFGVGVGDWRPEKNGSFGMFHVV